MNSANGGSIIFHFKGDNSNLSKSITGVSSGMKGMTKSILVATGITKALSVSFNVVKNSVGDAIKRIDTFKAYPKVMKNFGISTNEAKKSIDRIDKSVRGLPTSLDQAVAGVQDIFMVTKDLKQAEAMFKAINDSAMVFANGSTEAVQRFTYAYKQAMASGKVSAQDFNQMNEAIPGVMSKVAESMGMSFVELKKGLSDGSISMEQFNNALKKLDTEGGAGMKSLEETAKTSTGGIATQLTNAKTAVVRGVSSMIESVNTGLQKAGLGGIGQVIANAGSTIENSLKKIAPVIVSVITQLANFYSWIKKNKTAITIVTIALGSMYASFKVLTIISTITNIIKAFRIGIIALQTTATLCGTSLSTLRAGLMLLNLTFLASPIFWVIAGIIALIAVFVLLWNKCEGFRNFFIGLWEGIKNTVIGGWKAIQALFMVAIDFIKNNWKSILLFLVNPFAGAFKLLYDNCTAFRTFIDNLVKTVVNFFKNNWKQILAFLINPFAGAFALLYKNCASFRNFVNSFVNTVVNFFKSIPGKIKSVATGIVNVFKSLPSRLLGVGKNIIQGLLNGIKGKAGEVLNYASNLANKIAKTISKALKIKSPSRITMYQGEMTGEGFMVGLENIRKRLQDAVLDTFSLSPQLTNSSALHYSPNVIVQNQINQSTDPLGQTVTRIKTFSNGAKNDYNYGMGV